MKMNMGSIDKTIRILIAAVIGLAWATGYISGILAIVLLAVAGIFLFTSMLGFCPIYAIFGWSSAKN